jgi:hypothetical protein
VAYEIAPHQNGMVAIMIPHIRFSDHSLTGIGLVTLVSSIAALMVCGLLIVDIANV